MPGLLRFRAISNLVVPWLIAGLTAYVLAGCKGTEEAGKQEIPKESLKEFIAKYEATFDPSQFKVPSPLTLSQFAQDSMAASLARADSSAPPETTAGFRVQILTTPNIDDAMQMRDTLSASLPTDWVYVVYDSPYYKVRVGNYADRPTANKAQKMLTSQGYKDAWVVPDQVIKNPPPKPPPPVNPPDEPARQDTSQQK